MDRRACIGTPKLDSQWESHWTSCFDEVEVSLCGKDTAGWKDRVAKNSVNITINSLLDANSAEPKLSSLFHFHPGSETSPKEPVQQQTWDTGFKSYNWSGQY